MAKANTTNLDAQRLRTLLIYSMDTGVFTWRVSRRGHAKAGDVAGSISTNGYWRVIVDGHTYGAHRLAWLYVVGEWPKNDIDHRDGNRLNNRFSNLRDVSATVNQQNQRAAKRSNRSCGMLGVSVKKGNWYARIRVNGKRIHLGTFSSPTLAHEAYLKAKRSLHTGCTI